MHIFFLQDYFRAKWDGGNAERSGRWLHALIGPALRRLGHRTLHLADRDTAIQGLLADARKMLWPALFSDPNAIFYHLAILPHLAKADLVIGFELSPNQMRVLQTAKIPFLDVAIDPVRFAADLFLAVRTNMSGLEQILSKHAFPTDAIGCQARRPSLPIPDGSTLKTVFIGQTDIDAALVTRAEIGTVEPHLAALRNRFGDGETLWLKPHPYGRAHRDILSLHRAFPKARFTVDNIYAMLASGTVADIVTLSSGVATEAPFFGIPATSLLTPDRQQVENVSRFVRLSPKSLPLSLLVATGSSIGRKSRRIATLRSCVGLNWAYTPSFEPSTRHVRPSDIFKFGQFNDRDARPNLCGFGWSRPEPTGCWTDGALSTLLVDVAGQPLELKLRCRAYVPPAAAPVRITIEVRGAAASEQYLSFNSSAWRTVSISLPPIKGRLEIAVHVHNPRSPASLGLSDDHRALGLYITKACIYAQPANAPKRFASIARSMAASVAAMLIAV